MGEFFKISTIYDVAAVFSFFTSVIYLIFFIKDRCKTLSCRVSLVFQASRDSIDYYRISCKVINHSSFPAYLEDVTVYASEKTPVYRGFPNGGSQAFYKLDPDMAFSFFIDHRDLLHLLDRRNTDKLKLYMICRTQTGKTYKAGTISVKRSDISRPQDHGSGVR